MLCGNLKNFAFYHISEEFQQCNSWLVEFYRNVSYFVIQLSRPHTLNTR